MQEIKCPSCGALFQIDESNYAKIVSQIRSSEFEKELQAQQALWVAQQKQTEQIAKLNHRSELDRLTEQHNADVAEYKHKIENLQAQLRHNESQAKLDAAVAVQQAKESLNAEIKQIQGQIMEKEKELDHLKLRLSNSQNDQAHAISQAVNEKDLQLAQKEIEIAKLHGQLQTQEVESKIKEKQTEEKYQVILKEKDELIGFYKDLKSRQSTKMVGETLEQHCMTQFNQIRSSAFPTAYFEKDNDARTGSKGDFIYREEQDGTEFLSIMFEMKNETDSTSTKHKNEDFLKELDKDRREKNCEYAILVSLLEPDNELYNNGIVDVSYRYPKMYVIRPQFFIPVISMLRNASLNGLAYRQQLQEIQNRQIDLQNFESNINDFKEGFAKNFNTASAKFNNAIEEIDKTISHLQKVRDSLTSSERQLRLANDKAAELSIKKLTRNAPSVRALLTESDEKR